MVCLSSLEAFHTVCLYRAGLGTPFEFVASFPSYSDAYLYLKDHFHEFSSSFRYYLIDSSTYKVFDDKE